MRKWSFSLLVFPLLAATGAADEVHHPELGLHVKLPDGWERDRSMEDVDNLLHATFAADDEGKKQILVRISQGLAKDFDSDNWLAAEEEARKDFFDTVTNKFKHLRTQEFGDTGSIGYSVAGLGTPEGEVEAIAVAFQVYAVVNGAYYWQVEIISYREAHLEKAEAIDGILNAIKFPKPKVPPLDLTIPADATATEIKDEKGNIKWALPPGWTMRGEPGESADQSIRFELVRTNAKDVEVGVVRVWRFKEMDAGIFERETPTTYIRAYNKHVFGLIYGHADLEFFVDESQLLGGADKSGSYVISNRSKDEWAAINKIQKQIDKGIKISLPDPPMRVTRGYIALISPYVYMTQALHGGAGDDAGFVQALARLHEGFEFISGKATLPPLSFAGTELGNTQDDPANAKARKGKFLIEAFKHGGGGKKPSAKAQITFVVPPGFVRITDGVSGKALVFAAQDKDNNNVLIIFSAQHATELPSRMVFRSPRQQMESWKSNWESQARGTGKIKDKNTNMQLGNVRAKGYLFEGLIDGFKAQRRQFATIKSQWMLQVQIDARGDGLKVFEKSMKDFQKKFKFRKK